MLTGSNSIRLSKRSRSSLAQWIADRRGVIAVAAILYLWEGLPLSILDLPRYYGRQIVAVAIVLSSGIYLLNKATRASRLDRWEGVALIFLMLCILVSFISNNYIYPQDASDWVPALYLLTPILLIFSLKTFQIRPADIISGIVFAGITGALIVSFDHFVNISIMDAYERSSAFSTSERRIVFLKTEAAITATVIAIRAIFATSAQGKFYNLMICVPVFYSLIFISESRLAIAASMIGLAIFGFFVLKGRRRFKYIMISSALLAFFVPFSLGKYIAQFKVTDYAKEDGSVIFRLIEKEHFKQYFEKTEGIGFGVMSTGADKNNILANSGRDTREFGIGMGLADIGIYAALYQFGWIGWAFVIYMTLSSAAYMMRISRRSGMYYLDIGAIGAITLAYMLSPLPMNFFTLDSTAQIGGLLWALCGITAKMRGGNFQSPFQPEKKYASAN